VTEDARPGGEDPALRTVEPADEAGLEWIDQHVRAAKATIAAGGIEQADELSPETLDRLYAELSAELRRSGAEHEAVNSVINTVGLAFGQVLADGLGLTWVVVADEHGAEIALHAEPDFIFFPTTLVATRWESDGTDFLAETYETARAHLAELRSGPRP
jgi:Domain of unknown function (DUF3806)